jgi:hypothetical protein
MKQQDELGGCKRRPQYILATDKLHGVEDGRGLCEVSQSRGNYSCSKGKGSRCAALLPPQTNRCNGSQIKKRRKYAVALAVRFQGGRGRIFHGKEQW